jgi:hypothetical protein
MVMDHPIANLLLKGHHPDVNEFILRVIRCCHQNDGNCYLSHLIQIVI